MVLIVGLGNPGEKYNRTRHNVGFKTIEEIAKIFDFPIFTSKPIFKAEISKGTYNNKNIVLAKPKTFMNLSGQAVKLLIKSLDRFVLQKFNKEEEKIVNEVIRKTAEAVVVIMCKGVTKAMNTYNK